MAKPLKKPDYYLLGVCIVLLLLGILILSSVSADISQEKFGQSFYFLEHQLIFGLIPGVFLGVLSYKTKLSLLKKWAPCFLLVNLILLALVLTPVFFGNQNRGANRWITLGPISFQPGEFLKITLILYWAGWLSSRLERIKNKNFSLLIFFLLMSFIGVLFILQPDVSTFGVLFIISTLIYFAADTPFWHTGLIMLIGIVGFLSLINLAPYRKERLMVFLNPGIDPMGISYQLKQSLITIGSGGITGVGLGLSKQKEFGFLPESISDSIFAIFAEETGFVGSFMLIIFFLIFFWRAFKIALFARDKFFRLVSLGIGSWILLQAFINISSMIGIIPLTGIPLPFISYGGSALISELIGVGLLLNISKQI